MYSKSDLGQEVETVISEMQEEGAARLHPDWITQAVMKRHADISGDDVGFYHCVGRAEVRRFVAHRLCRYKVDLKEPDTQMLLPGFKRVQQWYLVTEDKQQVAVRVEAMTGEQIQAKVEELRAMGSGCYEHADELIRYSKEHKKEAA